jgi:hypothetical protein
MTCRIRDIGQKFLQSSLQTEVVAAQIQIFFLIALLEKALIRISFYALIIQL